MTVRETRFLLLGLVAGIAASFVVSAALSRREAFPATESLPPLSTDSTTEAVQLTPEEQAKIDLQTAEVAADRKIPRSAVIDTGTRKIAYVVREGGIFESRVVEVGPADQDRFPVLNGILVGERVVTNGTFLVDSQTRLTGGMTGLFGGSKSFREGAHTITFRIAPNPPRGGGESTAQVSVLDALGKPITDAQVRWTIIMPAMPAMRMPEMRSAADLKWNGSEYVGSVSVSMAGPWNVLVEARRGDEVLGSYRSRFDAK